MTSAWWIAVVALPFVTQIEGRSPMLGGLHGVAVVVEEVAPEAQRAGVTEERLRGRVIAALRRAGVPLLEVPDARMSARQPLLVVRLQTVAASSTALAWSLTVALHQRTAAIGAPPDTSLAQTWSATGAMGVTSARLLERSVGESLDERVAQFVAAWGARRK